MFGMSQEEAARRLGKSQSAVANKLRLLKLPEDVLETLRDRGLTERHGRALLCLLGREDDYILLWECIVRVGRNIILVDSKEEMRRCKRPRRF